MIRRYPSLFLLCFVVPGIVLAYHVHLSLLFWLVGGTIAVVLAVGAYFRNRRAVAAVLAGTALGIIAALVFALNVYGSGPNHLGRILVSPTLCQVYGRVDDWPELKRGRTEIPIEIDSLSIRSLTNLVLRKVDGRLLLKVTDTTTALQRGDRIAFQARLYPVQPYEQDGFDYGRYLNLRGIFVQAFLPTVLSVHIDRRPAVGLLPLVDKARDAIRDGLNLNLSRVESALACGFLIGETRDIPTDIYAMFRDSGTLHVLAVSGANVALVVLFFVWVMRPFRPGPHTRSFILLILIAVFTGVSYGDPSVMRASVMAALVIGARMLGRPFDLNNIIATAALVILLVSPAQLFDVGFQLSFVTAWGLVLVVPRVAAKLQTFHERIWYRWLVLPLVVALVAQVFSAPLIALYFQRIPLLSLAANLVIVPVVSAGVIAILVLLVAYFIWPLLGAFVGSLVNIVLSGVVLSLQLFGGQHMPIMRTDFLANLPGGPTVVVLVYLMLVLAAIALTHRWARKALIVSLALAANVALVVAVVTLSHSDRTRLRLDRVPGGVAVLVTGGRASPADLIVTGLAKTTYAFDESVLGPMLRKDNIDKLRYLTVQSADYDAVDDILRLARSFSVDTLWIHRDLGSVVSDVQARFPGERFEGAVLTFGGAMDTIGTDGYYLCDQSIRLSVQGSHIDIVDRPRIKNSSSQSLGSEAFLVIGSRWSPDPEDWIRLRQAGYARIICSEVEQRQRSNWPDLELSPDATPPDYVADLSHLGSVSVNLAH